MKKVVFCIVWSLVNVLILYTGKIRHHNRVIMRVEMDAVVDARANEQIIRCIV